MATSEIVIILLDYFERILEAPRAGDDAVDVAAEHDRMTEHPCKTFGRVIEKRKLTLCRSIFSLKVLHETLAGFDLAAEEASCSWEQPNSGLTGQRIISEDSTTNKWTTKMGHKLTRLGMI